MRSKNRIIAYSFTFLSTVLILLSFTLSGNAQTLYSCVTPNDGTQPFLRIIDPDTGNTLSSFDLTLPGFELKGCNGLAKDPTTGTCYMMLSTSNTGGEDTPGARLLVILNPFTGQLIQVGNTGQRYAGIAFDSGGTLYGLTGQQGGGTGNPLNPSTLFTINKLTAASTIFLPLVVNDAGESLAFNPNDGLLYRLSGGNNFESIDPDTNLVTAIPRLDNIISEPTTLTHLSGNVLYAASFANLYTLTTDGSASFVSHLDHGSKGLAFDCGVPQIVRPIPTLSEWGLIAMAGVLGIVGFMVLRRRKVTA